MLLEAPGPPASHRCKVCDLGISKRMAGTFLTTKHLGAGTPAYSAFLAFSEFISDFFCRIYRHSCLVAPELFGQGGAVGERCDVFSFAILVWESACLMLGIPSMQTV